MSATAGHLWVDPSAGVAGDMLLGALLDVGASVADVRAAVAAVAGDAVRVGVREVRRAGLRATQAVATPESRTPEPRPWAVLRDELRSARLPDPVRARALDVFGRLARAEGLVHGSDPEQVHFHEVGALDAIADVVGVAAALESLGVRVVTAGPVAVGSGTVRTAHGELPVPVPAVVELLRGVPTTGAGEGELATPTGAALLASVVSAWGPQPPLRVAAQGVGAGTREVAGRPNVVRVLLGETWASPEVGEPSAALLLESNVDDLDPRLWPDVLTRLLAAGASDAWLVPVLMKKGRPAHTLCILVPDEPATATAVRGVVFRETSAIGLREAVVAKHALDRAEHAVSVGPPPGQRVRVKVAVLDGVPVNAQPEWDDVAAAASALGRPAKAVLAEAVAAVRAAGLAP